MARNEDGEFELVLGNRQLLSVFFVVVVMLGVFFMMGYVVGRNLGPAVESRQAAGSEEQPKVIEPAAPATKELSGRAEPAVGKADDPPERLEEPKSAASTPGEVKAAAAEKPEPSRQPASQERAKVSMESDLRGLYWQVAAVQRPVGELLAEMLTRRGYQATLVKAPKGDLVRVVVGPAGSIENASKLKAELEGLGYKQPIKREYK